MLQAANQKLASASQRIADRAALALRRARPVLSGIAGHWQPPGWLRVVGAGVGLLVRWAQLHLAW